jgi:hypothetical protein
VLSIDSTAAISSLSLEKLGYFDEQKEEDKREEGLEKEGNKDDLKSSGEKQQKEK